MKLAGKLMLLMLLGIVFLHSVQGYLTIRREMELFNKDMRTDASLLGHALKELIADVWRTNGEERALELIEDANRDEHLLQIRWVWLDAPQGDPHHPHISREKLSPVARGQEIALKEKESEGPGYLYTYIPVKVERERRGALELAESLSMVDDYLRTSVVRMAVLTGTIAVVTGVLIVLLGGWIVGRPVQRLVDKARRMGIGDLSGPLAFRGHDEIAELGREINEMCEQLGEAQEKIRTETEARIAAIEQLRHVDRLRTVGTLSSGIAHELGTPLNVVLGRASMITAGGLSEKEIQECAGIIEEQTQRITTITKQLLDFARQRPPKRETVDVRELALHTLDLLSPSSKKLNITLSLSSDKNPVFVKVDNGQIQQVLTNLVVNAMQAMPKGGEVVVGIERKHAYPPEGYSGSEGDYLCLYVRDQGEGIPEESIHHIFDPFFTTKEVGQGTGLGLSISYGLVQENGGWIDVKSEPGKGSCFSIYLPQEDKECTVES